MIKKYLISIGVALDTLDVIPIMFDYNCEEGIPKCKNKYNSIN